jgi:hypothetical protein
MDVEGTHRNYAYSLARNGWVLSLDADEVVSAELRDEIAGVVNDDRQGKLSGYVVFAVPLRNYIGKYWVKWGGWYPLIRTAYSAGTGSNMRNPASIRVSYTREDAAGLEVT